MLYFLYLYFLIYLNKKKMSYKLTDIWNIDTKSIYNLYKNVGIGTSKPNYKLDVNGIISGNEIIENNKRLEEKYVQKIGREKFTDILLSKIPNEYVLEEDNIDSNLESNLLVRFRFDKGINNLNNTTLMDINESIDLYVFKELELEIITSEIDNYGKNYIIGNSAIYFNGNDTYLRLKNKNSSFNISGNEYIIRTIFKNIYEFTITFWFRIEDDDVEENIQKYTIFNFSEGNNCYFKLQVKNNSLYYETKILNSDNSSYKIYKINFENNLIDINEWYHLDIIYKENSGKYDYIKFYLNGLELIYNIYNFTDSIDNININTISYFKTDGSSWTNYIGCDSDISNYFKGYIDDFRIYNKELSVDDIKNELTGEVLKITTKGISTFGNVGLYLKPYEQKIGLGTLNPEKNVHISGDVLINNGNLYTDIGYIDNIKSSNINTNELHTDILYVNSNIIENELKIEGNININDKILLENNEIKSYPNNSLLINTGEDGILTTSNLIVTGNFNPNQIILDNLVSKVSLISDGTTTFNGTITINDIIIMNANMDFNNNDLLGIINIKGSEKINSGADLIIESGGDIIVNNGGKITIQSGGSIILDSGSIFTINTSLTFTDIDIETLDITTSLNSTGSTTLANTTITGTLGITGDLTTNNIIVNSGNILTLNSGANLIVNGTTTLNDDITLNGDTNIVAGKDLVIGADGNDKIEISNTALTFINSSGGDTIEMKSSTGNIESSGKIKSNQLEIDALSTLSDTNIIGTVYIGNTQSSHIEITNNSFSIKPNSSGTNCQIDSSGNIRNNNITANQINATSILINGTEVVAGVTSGGGGGTTVNETTEIAVKSLSVVDYIKPYNTNQDEILINNKLHIATSIHNYLNYSGASVRDYMNCVIFQNAISPSIISLGNNSLGQNKKNHTLTDTDTEIGKIEFIANQSSDSIINKKFGFTTHEINCKKQSDISSSSATKTKGTISIQGGISNDNNFYRFSVGNWNDEPKLEFFTDNTELPKFAVDKDGNVEISGSLTINGQLINTDTNNTEKWIGNLYYPGITYESESDIAKNLEDNASIEYKTLLLSDDIYATSGIWDITPSSGYYAIFTTGIYVPKEITQNILINTNTILKIDTIYQENTGSINYTFKKGIHKIELIIKY